jgi:hypothetical protein
MVCGESCTDRGKGGIFLPTGGNLLPRMVGRWDFLGNWG